MTNEGQTPLPQGFLLRGGQYRIVRFIDHGGFGCTYEAQHTGLGKRVAIKEFFHRDLCERDDRTSRVVATSRSSREKVNELRKKFIEEARAIAQLDHPNIVNVSDVFEENGTAYYVMNYIDGLSLSAMVKQCGPLSESLAVEYIRQVCRALSVVHKHKRLHLDIKPGNIMVDSSGKAILIDFGVSKQYREDDGGNSSILLGMSAAYAPPEQYDGDVHDFLPATDIYALGATLFTLLTGHAPQSVTKRLAGNDDDRLPDYVSAPVRNAVNAAMRLNKYQRPQSVDEFAQMLSGNDSNEPVVDDVTVVDPRPEPEPQPVVPEYPEPEPTKPEQPEPAPKSKLGFYVAALVAMAVTAVAVVVIKSNDKSNDSGGSVTSEVVVPTPATGASESTASTSSSGGSATGTSTSSSSSSGSGGKINGHEYVDLGLPSGVMWATCNVGANSPSDYGNYYAWGETSPKSSYDTDNSKTYGNSSYNRDIGGNASTDAARANWGGTWRLPTEAEFQELIDNCTWTWTTQGGHNGYKVTSKKKGYEGRSIFLPAAGWRNGSSLNDAGEYCLYWSSSPDGSYSIHARGLLFSSSTHSTGWGYRSNGFSVRPVSE